MEQNNVSFTLENGLRRGASYDSVFYGAYAGPGATFDIRVRFDFKRRLDLKKLQAAANEALHAYPEFAVTPVVYGGRVCYEKNDRSVRFVPDDGKRYYFGADGEDGTNGYLFLFLCGERHVTFSLFHGLTDARGMIAYVVTLLWLYMRALYPFLRAVRPKFFTQHGIRVDDQPFRSMDDTERYDPLVRFAAPGAPVDLINVDRLFRLPKEEFSSADPSCRLINLVIPNHAFYQKTKELNTTFAPLLAALVSEAIGSVYEIGEKQISVVTTVDGRRIFQTRSVANMAYNCPLPVEKAELSLPLAERCAKLRADMKKQITRENAEKTYSFILGQCAEIDAMGDIVSVNRALTGPGGLETLTTNGTIFLTYPGRVDSNPISRVLLRGVTPGMLAMERAVVVYAHRDELVIQITQKSDDLTLLNALSDTLVRHGFRPESRDMGRVTQNVFDFNRIRTL